MLGAVRASLASVTVLATVMATTPIPVATVSHSWADEHGCQKQAEKEYDERLLHLARNAWHEGEDGVSFGLGLSRNG